MIKIELNNIPKLQQEYYMAVAPKVIFRLEVLQTALQHVLRTNLPKKKKFTNSTEIGALTRKIINQMRVRAVPKVKFKQADYRKTVMYYTDRSRFTSKVVLQDILDLVTKLLDVKNGELRQLLTGPASGVLKNNDDLESDHNIYGKEERDIIALAFDYDAYTKITSEIKQFFRSRNFVLYCPYCNQEPAMYSGLSSKKTVRVHQLDHFFDKATHPLLSYSFFNLVPGDWTCNAINKKKTPFDDKNHMNPYISGFGKAMSFEPDYSDVARKMLRIKLEINPKAPAEVQQQLLGSKFRINENDPEGNINVFALNQKYNEEHVKVEAAKVHRQFLDNLNNMSTLHQFFDRLPEAQTYDYYRNWYEEIIRVPFEPVRFHEQRYSKLFRDLHDFVFENDAQAHNEQIRTIAKHFS